MFCPKCGSILLPKKEGKKQIMACPRCNFKKKEAVVLSESIKKEAAIEIVEEEQDMKHLPLTEVDCPKCGHKKARYWTIQTRAGDEPETKFMKCEKCRHVWRDYS